MQVLDFNFMIWYFQGTIDDEKIEEFEQLQKRSKLEISDFGNYKKQVGSQLFAGMRNTNLSNSVESMAWAKNSGNSSVIMQIMQVFLAYFLIQFFFFNLRKWVMFMEKAWV